MINRQKLALVAATVALLFATFSIPGSAAPAADSRFFPETGHTVQGTFLDYWTGHGGLAQQGYPISDEVQERSDTDGNTYTMQYFERAVFELHPENQPPNNVLLTLLGTIAYKEKYNGNAPGQQASGDNPRQFPETGHTIGGAFRQYWEQHGGLAQQGYPISDEFQEKSATDGKTYTVQYFQRAVFEYHPEFAGTSNAVLLSLLGRSYYNKRHNGGSTNQPTPTPTPKPQPVGSTSQILFFNGGGQGQPALIDEQGAIFNQAPFQLSTANWTHVVSVGGGYILFYKQGAGGRIGRLDPDGTYKDLAVCIPFAAGFDNVVALGNSMLAFLNTSNGAFVTYRVNVDGSVQQLKAITVGGDLLGGKMIASTLHWVLFVKDTHTSGGTTSTGFTAKVDDQGNLGTAKLFSDFTPGWTHLAAAHNDYLFFYNSNNGQALFGSVGGDGTFAPHPIFQLGAGWSGFADTSTGRFLAYRADTGAARVSTMDYYSGNNQLKAYNPGTLEKGWTYLIPVR